MVSFLTLSPSPGLLFSRHSPPAMNNKKTKIALQTIMAKPKFPNTRCFTLRTPPSFITLSTYQIDERVPAHKKKGVFSSSCARFISRTEHVAGCTVDTVDDADPAAACCFFWSLTPCQDDGDAQQDRDPVGVYYLTCVLYTGTTVSMVITYSRVLVNK